MRAETFKTLVLFLVLVCCLGTRTAEGAVRITYAFWNNPSNELRMIEAFNATHPDIQVEPMPIIWNGYMDKILLMQAGGTPPDVYMVFSGYYKDLAEQKAFYCLDEFIEKDIDFEAFLPKAWDYLLVNGHYYGTPRSSHGTPLAANMVVYNRDLFDASALTYPTLGWTFEDYVNTAKKLTYGEDGVTRQWGSEMPSLGSFIWDIIWSNGGDIVSADLSRMRIDAPEALEAIQWLSDLRHAYGVVPPASVSQPGDRTLFSLRTVAMAFVSSLGALNNLKLQRDLDWGFAQLPRGLRAEYSVSTTSGNPLVMAANTAHPEAAWTFMNWLMSEEAQEFEVFELGSVPLLTSIALSEAFRFSDTPPYDLTPWLYQQHRYRPQGEAIGKIHSLLQELLTPVMAGEVDLGQAIDEIVRQGNAILGSEGQ